MIKRILVGLGGTPYTPVSIRYAVELAQAQGAELTGVTAIDLRRLGDIGPVPLGGGAAAEDLREHRLHVTEQRVNEAVAEFERACQDAGVAHTVRHETGDAFELIVSLARYHDLMIFGLRSVFDHGLGEDPQGALASLIAGGVRPILAVADQYRPIRRALLAYSGSMESAKTIKYFVQMGLWPDVKLRVVTFDSPPDRAEPLLAEAAAYCQAHGYEPELEHSPDPAKHKILAAAEAFDADIVVMGNSARHYLLRQILGETTLHVIQTADRPLFLAQ